MKRLLLLAILLTAAACVGSPTSPQPRSPKTYLTPAQDTPAAHAQAAIESVWAATVVVERMTGYKFGGTFEGHGTGIAYRDDDEFTYVLTAQHVVVGQLYQPVPGTPAVIFESPKTVEIVTVGENICEVVVTDEDRDYAVIRYPHLGVRMPVHGLQARGVPSIGTRLWAVGTPFAYGKTLRTGLLSQKFTQEDELLLVVGFINPGDSGGPVFLDSGELIGLAVGFLEGRGLTVVCNLVGVELP